MSAPPPPGGFPGPYGPPGSHFPLPPPGYGPPPGHYAGPPPPGHYPPHPMQYAPPPPPPQGYGLLPHPHHPPPQPVPHPHALSHPPHPHAHPHPHPHQQPHGHPSQIPHYPAPPALTSSNSSSSNTQNDAPQGPVDPFLQYVVSASMIDLLDKKVIVVLRDNKKLVGNLLSFDQYSNLILTECFERKVIGSKYFDSSLGLYIVRGENVILLAELDESNQHKRPKKPKSKLVSSELVAEKKVTQWQLLSKEEFDVLEKEEKQKEQETKAARIAAKKAMGEEDFDF